MPQARFNHAVALSVAFLAAFPGCRRENAPAVSKNWGGGDLSRLWSKDNAIRSKAFSELNDMPPDQRQAAVPLLAEHLKDADPKVRSSVLEAFTFIPREAVAARAAVISVLKDSDISVRSNAGDVLAKTGLGSDAPAAVPLLIALLEDTEDVVQEIEVGGVKVTGRVSKVSARRSAAGALRDPGAQAAVPALLKVLNDSDEYIRAYAVSALGLFVSAPPVYEALLEALKSPSPHVRSNAAWELATGPRRAEALAFVTPLAKDPDPEVASAVARALAHGGEPEATAQVDAYNAGKAPEERVEWIKDIHRASAQGDAAAVEKFLKEGVDPNAADSAGLTPLFHAVFSERLEVMKVLIKHGADVNAGAGAGMTPLMFAKANNRQKAVELLVQNGAR